MPVPYKGDYVGLSQNPKWQKLYKPTDDSFVVFADNVMKINRADGKVSFWGFFIVRRLRHYLSVPFVVRRLRQEFAHAAT